MRYINTTNGLVEFVEVNGDGQILSSRGFDFGTLYFQIKNHKVTFYLNDNENPYRNDIFTIDLPFQVDGEMVDEENASAALSAIVSNNALEEKVDQLIEDLATESQRAKDAEDALDLKIDNETERAKEKESELDAKIDKVEEELNSKIDEVEEELKSDIEKVESDLNEEVIRSTVADALHDEKIESLSGSIKSLEEELDETNTNLQNEVTRSTAKDAEHDTAIEANKTAIDSEVSRATDRENELHNEILNETSRAEDAEQALEQKIDAEIVRSTEKDAVHDEKLASLDELKSDKVDTVYEAEYVSENKLINFKNIHGAVISSIDATDFIKDGMVDRVYLTQDSLVITFNTDAGKEDISIPLKDIFNPDNYYTKGEVDSKLELVETRIDGKIENFKTEVNGKFDVVNESISNIKETIGDIKEDLKSKADKDYVDGELLKKVDVTVYNEFTSSTNNKLDSIEKELDTKVDNDTFNDFMKEVGDELETKADADSVYTKDEVDTKFEEQVGDLDSKLDEKQDKLVSGVNIKTINDESLLGSGNIEVKGNNVVEITQDDYDKLTDKDPDAFYIITDALPVNTDDFYTKTQADNKFQTKGNYVTSDALNGKQDTLVSGTNIKTINGTSILGSGNIEIQGGGTVDAYTKAETDSKLDEKQNKLSGSYLVDIRPANDTGITATRKFFDNTIVDGDWVRFKTINGESVLGEGDIQIQGGGSSDSLWEKGTGEGSVLMKNEGDNRVTGLYSVAEGWGNTVKGSYAHAEGSYTTVENNYGHAEGCYTTTKNNSEHASGQFNISTSDSGDFGDSNGTLFTVGNGYIGDSGVIRHNAFEIRQNGDVYIADTNAEGTFGEKPMIKLQDALSQGGGGSTVDAYTKVESDARYAPKDEFASVSGDVDKINQYLEFTYIKNIYESNGTLAIQKTELNKPDSSKGSSIPFKTIGKESIFGYGDITIPKIWSGTKAAYNSIGNKDNNTIYLIHD